MDSRTLLFTTGGRINRAKFIGAIVAYACALFLFFFYRRRSADHGLAQRATLCLGLLWPSPEPLGLFNRRRCDQAIAWS